MALEHRDEILRRYRTGIGWRETYLRNTIEALSEETGHSRSTIRRAVTDGRSLVAPAEAAYWKARLNIGRRAKALWARDSVETLKKEYHMSTDTLNKIIDEVPPASSGVINNPHIVTEVLRCHAIYTRYMELARPDMQITIAAEIGKCQSFVCKIATGQLSPKTFTASELRSIRSRVKRSKKLMELAKPYGRANVRKRLEISEASLDRIIQTYARKEAPELPKPVVHCPDNLATRFLTGKPVVQPA